MFRSSRLLRFRAVTSFFDCTSVREAILFEVPSKAASAYGSRSFHSSRPKFDDSNASSKFSRFLDRLNDDFNGVLSKIHNATNQLKIGSEKAVEVPAAVENAIQAVPIVADAIPDIVLSSPTTIVINLIELLHTSLSMPYWSAVVFMAIGVRVLTFPLIVLVQQNSAKFSKFRPALQKIRDEFDKDARPDRQAILRYRSEYAALKNLHKVRPALSFLLPLIQVPTFLTCFFALRDLPIYIPNGLATGGVGWFLDLTTYDPYYVVQLMTTAAILGSFELNRDSYKSLNFLGNPNTFANIMRGVAILTFPLTCHQPVCLFLYWFCNSTMNMVQTYMFKTESIRMALNIPMTLEQEETAKWKAKIDALNKDMGVSDEDKKKLQKEYEEKMRGASLAAIPILANLMGQEKKEKDLAAKIPNAADLSTTNPRLVKAVKAEKLSLREKMMLLAKEIAEEEIEKQKELKKAEEEEKKKI